MTSLRDICEDPMGSSPDEDGQLLGEMDGLDEIRIGWLELLAGWWNVWDNDG